MLHVHLNI